MKLHCLSQTLIKLVHNEIKPEPGSYSTLIVGHRIYVLNSDEDNEPNSHSPVGNVAEFGSTICSHVDRFEFHIQPSLIVVFQDFLQFHQENAGTFINALVDKSTIPYLILPRPESKIPKSINSSKDHK